jgi:hypothetical protein
MAQEKICRLTSTLDVHKAALSRAIHLSAVDAPACMADEKRHCFIGLATDCSVHPGLRSANCQVQF